MILNLFHFLNFIFVKWALHSFSNQNLNKVIYPNNLIDPSSFLAQACLNQQNYLEFQHIIHRLLFQNFEVQYKK